MSPRAWVAFAAVSALWGIPYLFIKVAVDDGVPPAALAWARVVLGAVVLLVLARRAGTLGALRGRGRAIVLFAVVEIAVPFPLIAVGEQRVASSLAAIVIATVPLLIALLALRFDPGERVRGRRLAGLFVGLGGVVALVGIDVGGHPGELVGVAALLVAALGYACGPLVLKLGLADRDPRATMGASLAVAAVLLTPAALLDPPSRAPSSDAVLAVLVLGLACTAAAFVLMATLVAEVGPSRASVVTYVNPLVAVALGITVLGERPGPGAVAGLLLILAGSWLSTDGRLPPGLTRALARAGPRRAPTPRRTPPPACSGAPAAPGPGDG